MTRSARIAKKQEDISIAALQFPLLVPKGRLRLPLSCQLLPKAAIYLHLSRASCARGKGPHDGRKHGGRVTRAVVPREPKPHANEIAKRHDGYGLAVVT